jgi:hypothetical protein
MPLMQCQSDRERVEITIHYFTPDETADPESDCDGYNHPPNLVREFAGGEWACMGCGVSLV